MFKKQLSLRKTLLAGLFASVFCATSTYAADHADSDFFMGTDDPAVKQADINDLYAFMNPNNEQELVMVMTIFPNASPQDTFSTVLNYNFFMQNYNGGTAGEHYRITCTFPDTTQVSCSLGGLTTAGAVGGTVEPGNGLRVYTGLRDDPFFFNSPGLRLSLDAGVPVFTDPQPENAGGLPNTFANQNILALIIGVDRNLLTNNQENPTLRLWTSTESN